MRKYASVTVPLLVLLPLLAGCKTETAPTAPPAVSAESSAPAAAAKPSAAAPQMDVTLWSRETIRGPLDWQNETAISVNGRAINVADIKVMQTAARETSAAKTDLAKLPEPMRPLSKEAIASYRARAKAAAEKFKGSDSILCLDLGEEVLRPDGAQVYRYHALHLILKDAGRSVANVSVGSQLGRSRAKVLFSRSISPDGVSRWSDESTFSESVPPQSEQFMDTRARMLSGQVPGADVDMLIEYAYEQEEYNPEIADFFFPGYVFQSDKPVLDSVIDVLVPEGRKLNYFTMHMPDAVKDPARSKRDGYDVYRWEMKDAPVIVTEPDSPPMGDLVARMDSSLFFKWDDLMNVTGRFQEERLKVTPDIKQAADTITAGKTTDDDKVAAIYHWVQRNINYLSIKASLSSGWAGHPASETLKAGYGDCTDVSTLMASLCRAVGVDAYPVDIKTNEAGRAVTEIPMPDQNHAIVLAYPDGKPRFLDPTSQDFRYPYFRADDHGVKAILSIKHQILDIPVPPPEDNMRESRQEMALAADGTAKIVEKNAYTGTYEAGVRGFWRNVPPEMRGKLMQQSLQSRCPGAVVDSFDLGDLEDLGKQLKMEIDYNAPCVATIMDDLYIFTLPNFKQQFPETALEKRKYDIEEMSTMEFDTEVKIDLPEGFTIAGLPEQLVVHGKHLSFVGSVEKSEDGKSIVAKQVFKRLTRVVPVADYDEFRAEASKIASWTDVKIVLRKPSVEAPETPSTESTAAEEVTQ